MKYSKNMIDMLVLEARNIFVDANEYDDYELVGYCRLVRALCKRYNTKLNSRVKIENIRKILKTLDERKNYILCLRYWEGYTLIAIGELLSITHEGVRQNEKASLERLKTLISQTDGTENNIPIEVLGLNSRVYWTLKHEDINTVGQLILKDYASIKGVGQNGAKVIKQKLKDLNFQLSSDNRCVIEKLPIDTLDFSTRVNNALKRKGIFIIEQLLAITMEEVYRIQGIGKKGYDEVLRKKQNLENFRD